MSAVAEIEQAISRLSREEFREFETWFAGEKNRLWDQQIEGDAASGALDFLVAELDTEIAKGTLRPLHEVVGHP